MIKKFVEAWDENKENLEEYFRVTPQKEYSEYIDLVKLLFDIVINPSIVWEYNKYNTNEIRLLDDGDYQGTQIFILHQKYYQPDVESYVYTHTYYGSCSGCDTLLGISMYSDELPDEEQVKDYMELCLHLLQKCTLFTDEEYVEPIIDKECVEPIKMTYDEYMILKNIKGFKWIARDNTNLRDLGVFQEKPFRAEYWWYSYEANAFSSFSHLFQFIKWEDEPYEIEKLIKNYEKEHEDETNN